MEQAIAERAAAFSGDDLPLAEWAGLRRLARFSGSVPETAWDRLDPAARAHGVLVRLGRRRGRVHLVAVTTPTRRPQLEEALRHAGFRPEPLPPGDADTPEAEFARSAAELRRLEEQWRREETEGTEIAVGACRTVERVEALADDEERMLHAVDGFPRTRTAALLAGWVAVEDAARVMEAVRSATEGRCAVTFPADGEAPASTAPVVLRPPGWLRPFARLVEPYGLPRYGEMDPTLFVAAGYLVMFGMMFGDVGHGALLVLAGLGMRLLFAGPVVRDLGLVLAWAGLASAGFGLVYGSCFGLPSFREHALWRDPLEGDPMELILGAMALGAGTLGLGIGLNLLNRWRARDWTGMALDHFGVAGALFYATGILWVLQGGGRSGGGLPPWVFWLGLGVPLVAWCLRPPLERILIGPKAGAAGEGSLGGALVKSIVGAFEVTLLFLANTVSFVRLAAYALSHAAILAAAFTMADQVRSMPRLGATLAVVLIVAGNLAAMVLEGLVASVQALRLQYYEFLGKFFSGEGTPFTPFRLRLPSPVPALPGTAGAVMIRVPMSPDARGSCETLAVNERQSS